jgi:cyclin A
MRGILVDWLVEVAEEYKLAPENLYLSTNYVDRFLTVMPVLRGRLQLVGVTCMLIASKYEEIFAPQVEDFVYITDSTYTSAEVLHMEVTVLNALRFNLTAVTPHCFLKRLTSVLGFNDQVFVSSMLAGDARSSCELVCVGCVLKHDLMRVVSVM